MATAAERYEIQRGPSKFDMMVSLFSGAKLDRKTVSLRMRSTTKFVRDVNVDIVIEGVKREDDSGEEWLFSGVICSKDSLPFCEGETVKGCFNTSDRRGLLLREVNADG